MTDLYSWLNSFLALVVFGVSAYTFLVLLAFFFQKKLIFFPDRSWGVEPGQSGMLVEDLTLGHRVGSPVSAWWLPVPAPRATVLFCHGNAGNISHRLDAARVLQTLSLNVLLFDYRGYGKSAGRPSEQGLYDDGETAWRYLVETRGLAPDQIVILGKSLGGPVAAYLAARHRPGGLILQSTFTSIVALASRLYPYLPVRLLTRFRFPTGTFLSKVKCPVLVVHSRDDEIIPIGLGHALMDAAGDPKQWCEITGGHNDGMFVSGEAYFRCVGMFLDAAGLNIQANSPRSGTE